MSHVLELLVKSLEEARRIDQEYSSGTDNQLLVQCRRNDQLARRMKDILDAAFGRSETAAFWSKYREIFLKYARVIQGVSLVTLYSKMHSGMMSSFVIPGIRIYLQECYKYSEVRAQRLETGLTEAFDLLTRIDAEAQNVQPKSLGVLFLTFDEKLRIAALDANESTEKVRETYSAIAERVTAAVGETNRNVTIVMGALLGASFGGLLSWIYGLRFNVLPCLAAASFAGALIANYYSSSKRTLKLQYSQYGDKFENARHILADLVEQVERESRNI